ncbi:uncharacterized protein LOC135938049 [Cloeon dipterum]|uniref:uncharacterized protein LOC135938049 n=1 Tax=Cloeon dipterum TaxID=197152 RepID=UPI00321FC22F
MPNCVVKGCSSNSTNPDYDDSGRKVTLHQFPTKVTRAEWIKILRERGGRSATWEPNANAKICSMHFDESDIDRTGQCVRIKAYAVPVYFSALKRKSRKRPSEEQPADAVRVLPQQQPSPPTLIPIKGEQPQQQQSIAVAAASPPAPLVQVLVTPPATPLPPPQQAPDAASVAVKIVMESALPMVSKEVSITPPTPAPATTAPKQAPSRSMHTLTTKATLEPISSPILGSIMRGTPLTKREQMLNSPAVTSTLVEKCIRRSKKFQELVSGEKDPSILRGIISKTLKDVNFYEALKNNLNCEKERQMSEERERELRQEMIMQEIKALTATSKYIFQQTQNTFENFFKLDLELAARKIKCLRDELKQNCMMLDDKFERIAQIIDGENRKYEPVMVAPAPILQPVVNSMAEMYLTNGYMSANAPGLTPVAADKLQHLSRPQAMQQQAADTVETVAAVASIVEPTLMEMAAEQEPAREFNPKTYLPKKHKAMLKYAAAQAHRTSQDKVDFGSTSASDEDVEVARKRIKLEEEGRNVCLAK